MIHIPTYDLVTMIRNVAECAPTTRTDRTRAYVRLACTGDALVASTYALSHGAVATWQPPHPEPGGLDDPWEVILRTAQAKTLARIFELNGEAALNTMVTLDKRHDALRVSRPGDSEGGVDELVQSFTATLDVDLPYAEKEFADLGALTSERDPVIRYAAASAIGLACKRTYADLTAVAYERAVVSTVGEHLTVYSRYPSEAEQREADELAIVAVSLEPV